MPGCKALMLRRVRRGYIKGDFKMKDAVVIKGNKAGMTVYLEKDLNFEEVLHMTKKYQMKKKKN